MIIWIHCQHFICYLDFPVIIKEYIFGKVVRKGKGLSPIFTW